MIEKIVRKRRLDADSPAGEDLRYWLEKGPEERISAVEILRRQYNGSTARLQRTARVIQQAQG